MRDLYKLLEQMQNVIANTRYSHFDNGFESLKNSVSYAPPESMMIWFKETHKFLFETIIPHVETTKFKDMNNVEQKLIVIWTDKTHSELMTHKN